MADQLFQTLLKIKEVQQRTSLGRSHLYAMMKKNQFPRPIDLSDGRVAWVSGEVKNWIDARIAARDGGAAK